MVNTEDVIPRASIRAVGNYVFLIKKVPWDRVHKIKPLYDEILQKCGKNALADAAKEVNHY